MLADTLLGGLRFRLTRPTILTLGNAMPDDPFNARRFFLKLAASAGLSALVLPQSARAFFGGAKEFEWLPSECADERYPMQLISGVLISPDGTRIPVPTGKIINNGWGEVGSIRLVGTAQKPVPEKLELAWFSYTEDRFYGGEVALPHALLTQLFEEGFTVPLTQERSTWHKIIVGMGLGGWTSIWLAGDGLVREVARARLEPVTVDWSRVIDNPDLPRQTFIRSTLTRRLGPEALATLSKNGPPVSSWPRYAQRERWRLAVAKGVTPHYLFLRGSNGERQFHDFTRSAPGPFETIPKHAQIAYRSPSGSTLLAEISFDENEIFSAFERGKTAGTTPPTLHFNLKAHSRIAIALETAAGRIALQHSHIEVGRLSP